MEGGSIQLVYCPTNDMVANTLIKALPSMKAKHFASQASVWPLASLKRSAGFASCQES